MVARRLTPSHKHQDVVASRKRSARAVRNDDRLRRAVCQVVAQAGIDKSTMVLVAKRAGLTTGALYARFETIDDAILDAWQAGAGEMLFVQINDLLATVSPGAHGRRGNYVLSPQANLAFQVLIASRRNATLAEGIESDVTMWADKWDLGDRAPERVRMKSAVALSLIFGRLAGAFVPVEDERWESMASTFAVALDTATSGARDYMHTGTSVVADGGDGLANDLINATMEVVARSGVEASTLSRIARRAHVTTGAIYSRYESKANLIVDAIEILVATAARTSSQLVIEGANTNAMSTSVARMFHAALSPDRSRWNAFRLETYLAGHWDQSIRRCLRRIRSTSDQRYVALLQPTGWFTNDHIAEIALAGQAIPLGMSVLDIFSTGHRNVDYLDVSKRLMVLVGAS